MATRKPRTTCSVPLQSDRAGDPEYDFLLGSAALGIGKNTEAVFALERVLAVQPNSAPARALIARAYFNLKETETARREFENVKKQDVPPEVSRQRSTGSWTQSHGSRNPSARPSAGSSKSAAVTTVTSTRHRRQSGGSAVFWRHVTVLDVQFARSRKTCSSVSAAGSISSIRSRNDCRLFGGLTYQNKSTSTKRTSRLTTMTPTSV